MTRILLWIEPHPIRGRHDEFFDHAVFLAEALLLRRETGVAFSVFSNSTVIDRLAREYPAVAPYLMHPAAEETAFLDAEAGDWTESRKATWLDLVAGTGPAAERYLPMARRVLDAAGADAVVMWSDNGVLRRAASEAGLPAFSCELGPTRAPFPPTFYIDPAGTNGQAAMRACRLRDIAALDPAGSVALARRAAVDPAQIDRLRGVAARAGRPAWAPEPRFALVPLQLGDDLNTLLHAPYRSPRDFLQAVLPPLLAAHGRVVVKGHPGVDGRPGNAVLQDAALDLAASFGDRVTIAPERLPEDEQAWLLGNASLVCAMNSSVAFEALLLDRPVVLLGDAAFDLDNTLKRPLDRLGDAAGASDRLLMRAGTLGVFLHRKDPLAAGDAILEAIARAPAPISPRAWVDASLASLARTNPESRTPAPWPGTAERLTGYVEQVEETAAGGGRIDVVLRGWLHDAAEDMPVRRVTILSGGDLLAEAQGITPRPDVARRLRARTVSLGFDLRLRCAESAWRSAVLCAEDSRGRGRCFAIVAGRLIPLPPALAGRYRPQPTLRDGRGRGRLSLRSQRLGIWIHSLLRRGVMRRGTAGDA